MIIRPFLKELLSILKKLQFCRKILPSVMIVCIAEKPSVAKDIAQL
ncbi:hypothetical protein [Apibacter sp. B3706]